MTPPKKKHSIFQIDSEHERDKEEEGEEEVEEKDWKYKAKIIGFHLSLWSGVVLYAFFTGYFLFALERTRNWNLTTAYNVSALSAETLETLEKNLNWKWSLTSAIRFQFSIFTLIGTSNLGPQTKGGKIFCMLSGLLGIPLTMLAIADLGKFLLDSVVWAYKRLQKVYRKAKNKIEDGEDRTKLVGAVVLFAFCVIYSLITIFIVPFFRRDALIDRVFGSFVAITTLGFGDMVLAGPDFSLSQLVYVTIGLALITMSIEAAADLFKKIHYVGMKLENVGNAFVWFGGKRLTVNQLLEAVEASGGTENLDKLVAEAIRNDIRPRVRSPVILSSPTASPLMSSEKAEIPEELTLVSEEVEDSPLVTVQRSPPDAPFDIDDFAYVDEVPSGRSYSLFGVIHTGYYHQR